MDNKSASDGLGVVFSSLIIAFILAVAPLPEWLNGFRPAWVPLTFIYWVIAMPHRIGVISGWTTGLLLDAMTGSVLGQNALALALVAYIAYLLHMRIRVFPLWQQCVTVLVLVGIYQLVNIVIMRAVYISHWTLWYWVSVGVSALVWPLVTFGIGLLRGRGSAV